MEVRHIAKQQHVCHAPRCAVVEAGLRAEAGGVVKGAEQDADDLQVAMIAGMHAAYVMMRMIFRALDDMAEPAGRTADNRFARSMDGEEDWKK